MGRPNPPSGSNHTPGTAATRRVPAYARHSNLGAARHSNPGAVRRSNLGAVRRSNLGCDKRRLQADNLSLAPKREHHLHLLPEQGALPALSASKPSSYGRVTMQYYSGSDDAHQKCRKFRLIQAAVSAYLHNTSNLPRARVLLLQSSVAIPSSICLPSILA